MAKERAISFLKDRSATRVHTNRVGLLRRVIREESWDLDGTLRAFSTVVFYSGRLNRQRVIAWLEELLMDLKNTKRKLVDPDDGADLWRPE